MGSDERAGFQRARRPEQREQRRQEIIDAAEELLAELPPEAISLRELARRLEVSKTHVVRYFESREGVFLELLRRQQRRWLDALPDKLPPAPAEPDRVMSAWATSLAERPALCQLWSLLPSVLERNVGAETVRDYKLAELGHRADLARLVSERISGLDTEGAQRLARYAVVALVGLWPFCNPAPAVAEAIRDPRLADSRVDFAATYADILHTTFTGLTAPELGTRPAATGA